MRGVAIVTLVLKGYFLRTSIQRCGIAVPRFFVEYKKCFFGTEGTERKNTMKKILLLIGVVSLLSSCKTTVNVVSRNAYDNAIEQVKGEFAGMGYVSIGVDSENRTSVEVGETVKYTYQGATAGYSQRMDNVKYVHETYYFKDDNGNELSFKTVLKPQDEILLNVSMEGCKTSNAKDYAKLCGNESPIKKHVSNLKPDTTMEVFDMANTYLLIGGLTLVGTILCYISLL